MTRFSDLIFTMFSYITKQAKNKTSSQGEDPEDEDPEGGSRL